MKKDNLLILTMLVAFFFIGSRLVFQQAVLFRNKKESVPSSQEQAQKKLGSNNKLANSGSIHPKLNEIRNDNRIQKITLEQNMAQVKMLTRVIKKNSDMAALNKNLDAKKQEIVNYVSEVHHRLKKQDEFLKLKVGLSDEQIKMVHTKNVMFQKQIEFAKLLAVKKSPSANRVKMMILAEHSDWMTYLLGAENFSEYMQMAPQSYNSGINEI